MFVLVALSLASTSAATTATQPAPATSATAPAPAKPVKEKKICRTADADAGSHMIRRICKTPEEWNQQPDFGTGHSGFSISGDKLQGH